MKKKFAKLVILFAICFIQISNNLNAQNQFYKTSFIDTNNLGTGSIVQSHRYQNDFIVAGNFTDVSIQNACIKRVDTLGNILWTSTASDSAYLNLPWSCGNLVEQTLLVDSFIYYLVNYNTNSYPYPYRLTKMNVNTGQKIWQTDITNLDISSYSPSKLVNINATEIGFYYYSVSNDKNAICKIDKIIGTATNYFIGGQIFGFGQSGEMCVDVSNNIYVTKLDSIFKINSVTMNVIWEKSYSSFTYSDNYISDLFCTPTDSLIALTHSNNTSSSYSTNSISINKSNGNINWQTPNTTASYVIIKSIVEGDYLYNFSGSVIMSSTNSYEVNKINLTNGNEIWSNTFTINSANGFPIRNIAIDNNFLYCISYDNCAGVVMKLNSSNGNLSNYINLPYGYCNTQWLKTMPQIHLLNGSLYAFSSNIKDSLSSFEEVNMSKISPNTLSISSITPIDGSYHFSSETVDIKNKYVNKKIVLKKIGKSGKLIMYNSLKQILWSRNVGENFYSQFGPVSFTNDGRIVVSSINYVSNYCSSSLTLYNANYAESLTMEYFDSLGVFLYKNIQPINTSSFSYNDHLIAEVIPDTGYHALVIMHFNSGPNRILDVNELGASNFHTLAGTNMGNLPVNNVEPFALTSSIDSFTYININNSNDIKLYSYRVPTKTSVLLKTLHSYRKGLYYINVPTQNSYILATNNSTLYTIEKFDNNINTISWSITIFNPIKKIIKDVNNQYIYVIANRVGAVGEIWLYKIEISSGVIVWQRTNGTLANDIPLNFNASDITIDDNNNLLSIASYQPFQTNSVVKKVGLFRYDFMGTLIDTFVSVETGLSYEYKYKISNWPNGSAWLYGAVQNPSNQLYGYSKGIIYDTDSSTNNQNSYSTINQIVCNSFIFNNQNLTSSGIFFDTLINSTGNDSIITLILTINTQTNAVQNIASCNPYFFNNQTLTQSGIYYDTLVNVNGCDSMITLNLSINPFINSTINQSACNTFFFNNQTLNSSGIYYDTLINTNGCDSIITLNLTINNPTSNVINQSSCSSYYFNNQALTTSGIYYDTLINSTGCDSIITLNLTINNPNIATSQNGTQLSASASGASYQWLKCNPFTIISGANSQTYTATANGNYAVVVTQNGCSDTSNCMTVNSVGINELNTKNLITISPNPTNSIFKIECPMNGAKVILYNSFGQKLLTSKIENQTSLIDISHFSKGIYIAEIIDDKTSYRVKVIKE